MKHITVVAILILTIALQTSSQIISRLDTIPRTTDMNGDTIFLEEASAECYQGSVDVNAEGGSS